MQKNRKDGSKTWYIADGWIPSRERNTDNNLEGHEALMILNYQTKTAELIIDIFFEDIEPIENIKVSVPGKRVKCLRMDNPDDIGGIKIDRLRQYALKIKSNIEIIVQYGRMDITQDNLAYIGMMGFPGV